ncbi:hypothetical protein PQX77_008419 [Marasmius sp. AFHP31]|nr:hypothetical protein PQX77_013032 [Marasmius sp. AFHP31]KAK1228554.1 hypothetical protein PQX77_008419 [Marasmius sp. AFHP31]
MTTQPDDGRPKTLRSVHSNSSMKNSTTSSRRPWFTRARAKTLTGGSPAERDMVQRGEPVPPVPLQRNVAGVEKDIHGSSAARATTPLDDPRRYSQEEQIRHHQVEPAPASASMAVAPVTSRTVPGYQPPPSAFNRVPLSLIDTTGSTNIRDSVLTQDSYLSQPTITSSSIYPQSTSAASTASATDSLLSELEVHGQEVPVVEEVQDFDSDDVSYRLRLLVKNIYQLPPAHTKPKPSDFATTSAPPSKKPPTPTNTFLDRFWRPKSKPTTPTSGETPGPLLRATSDNSTMSPYGTSAPTHPSHPLSMDVAERALRVVVVREKMEDLATAAKQAEQEMKERGIRQERTGQQKLDNVIDPTDFVDVPLPASGYPFAVQTSTSHGLGVEESVGAAVLADRLPPSSPSGSSQPDDDWRKALLKAAVGHSLEHLNTIPTIPSPPTSGTTSPVTVDKIGLRIISNPSLQNQGTPGSPSPLPQSSSSPQTPLTPTTPANATPSTPASPAGGIQSSIFSQELPARVDTPSAPLTPLQPPPRRQIINPLYSLSQTDLTSRPSQERRPSSSASKKGAPSPMLANIHESDIRPGMVMTPPPVPSPRVGSAVPFAGGAYVPAEGRSASPSVYSFDASRSSRSRSRASTRSSQNSYGPDPTISPTASAFQDALSGPPSMDYLPDSARPSFASDRMLPPPRVSSSLARLSPLSRSPYSSRRPSPQKAYSEDYHGPNWDEAELRPSTSSARTAPPEIEIFAPEPTTPPLPLDDRPRRTPADSLSIRIPPGGLPSSSSSSIRSAPPPSTAASFFDTIESQHSSELDSSSDEDSDDGANADHGAFSFERPSRSFASSERQPFAPRSTTPQPQASTSRTPIMRLGNHSTPYISRTSEEQRSLFGSKEAVGHVHTPQQTSFFTDRQPVSSTLELYQYAAGSRRRETVSSGSTVRSPGSGATSRSGTRSPQPRRPATMEERINQKLAQNKKRDLESLKRLDEMFKQHMQDEKERIKEITVNSRVGSTSNSLPQPS